MKTIWIDVETTGLDYKENKIIELAALYEDGETKDIFHRYCKPETKPEDFENITEITGITWEYLEENGITEREIYKEFVLFLGKYINKFDRTDKAIFAAYNAKFDNQFIRQLFINNNDNYFGSWFLSASLDIISTVALAVQKNLMPVQINNQNGTIAKYFNIDFKAHSALEDIKASRQVQKKLESLLGIK